MQPYDKFRYIYPPRPNSKIPFNSPILDDWLKFPDAVVQPKLNGSRNVIFVTPERQVKMYGRDGGLHKSFTPSQQIIAQVLSLPLPAGWNVLDSELMHLKTTNLRKDKPSVTNTLYFYDVLVHGGTYLTGVSYDKRYKIIEGWGLKPFPVDTPKVLDHGMFVAQNLPKDRVTLLDYWNKFGGDAPVDGGDVFFGEVGSRMIPNPIPTQVVFFGGSIRRGMCSVKSLVRV